MSASRTGVFPMHENELDHASLRNLKDLLGDKFPELVETFLRDSNGRLSSIRNSLKNRDARKAAHDIHALKGSCRNIGANPLAELCEILERQTIADLIVDTEQQLAAIEHRLALVAGMLRGYH